MNKNRTVLFIVNRTVPFIGIALLLAAGCATPAGHVRHADLSSVPPAQRVFFCDPEKMAFKALAGASAWHGVRPNGAGYRIEVPDDWNGVLVMYAHGYHGTTAELTITNSPLREWLIPNGFAWAASTYSRNFYDVRAGIEDTNELALAFSDITGLPAPVKYYIMGHSMGGHIAAAAVEAETLKRAENVVRYAGALSLCGVVGKLSRYFSAFIKAAEELAGTRPVTRTNDPVLWENVILPSIKEKLWHNFDADKYAFTAAGEPLYGILKNLSGGPRPVFDISFGSYLERLFSYGAADGTYGGILQNPGVDTRDIIYRWESFSGEELTAAEEKFNKEVFRVVAEAEAKPSRRDGLRLMPPVRGELTAPVVTLHDLGDLFVPFSMQQEYRRAAQAKGSDDLLVQRIIRTSRHCAMNNTEMLEAFLALMAWEIVGPTAKPAGDDVLNPAVVADENYGCNFTRETREGIAACPAVIYP